MVAAEDNVGALTQVDFMDERDLFEKHLPVVVLRTGNAREWANLGSGKSMIHVNYGNNGVLGSIAQKHKDGWTAAVKFRDVTYSESPPQKARREAAIKAFQIFSHSIDKDEC